MADDDIDFESFPLRVRGHGFDDFEAGQQFSHHWGRTLTAADNAVFSTATCNWNPMHLNREFARAHGHDDVVVNPMLVLCTVLGLSVEDLSEAGGAFLGLEDLRFHRAVYPDDTLTAASEVVETRASGSRPDAGIVTWRTEARNQDGQLVVDFTRTNLVLKREA